jgi:hypothetical protein
MRPLLTFIATLIVAIPLQLAADDQQDTDTDIARGGERYDQSLENREDRASENGNTNRADDLQNRDNNAQNRQDNRPDNNGG